MLKKEYLTRLEKLSRKLAPRYQEGIVVIKEPGDPISYKGCLYESHEEFHKKFPGVRIVAFGMTREAKQWEEEREREKQLKRFRQIEQPQVSSELGK